MSDSVAQEIQKKILRERNIIIGASNLKKKTTNATVIQKCNTNIQEAQQNIDYLNERLNQLKFQDQLDPATSHTQTTSNDNNQDNSANFNNNGPVQALSKRSANSVADTYSHLDLIKSDCPSLGQRIQYMINQLDTKLKVEQKYYQANEKLSKIYQLDGDRRISSVAEDGRIQSNHKIQLLKKSLKRYEDINISLDQVHEDEESAENIKFRRKPLAGTLTITISALRDVDHIASPMFSRKTESYISIKVDDEEKARTKGSRNDKWGEDFNIHVEKGNEVEITVYDKISGSYVPVAIAWFLISDIAEEIRKKKVDQSGVGWVSASRIQNGSNVKNPNTTDNFTLNEKEEPTTNSNSKAPVRATSWFIMEPAGQILLTLGFTKSTTQSKKTLLGGLHRHGAIRKRDEEVFEQHGHQFVQKSFYGIMRCALCGDFLPYNGYQCQDCKFLCHKRCFEKVVTKCISKSSTDVDPDELKLNHRIPHRFEHVSNRGTNWCCHCGYILPWSRKNVLRCSECDTMCHVHCSHLVPDLCGMSMETANEILKAIKDTEGSRKKHIQNFNSRQSGASSTPTMVNKEKVQPELVSLPSTDLTATTSEYSTADLPTQSLNQQQTPAYQTHPQRRPPPSDNNQYPYQHKQEVLEEYQEQQHQQQRQEQERQRQLEQQRLVEEERQRQEQQYVEDRRNQLLQEKERQQELQRQQEEYQQQQEEYRLQQQYLEQQHHHHYQQQQQQQQQQQHQQQPQPDQYDLSFQKDQEDAQSNRQSQYSQISGKNDGRPSLELELASNHSNEGKEVTKKQKQRVSYSADAAPVLHHHKEKRHRTKVGLDDFNFISVLGRGNFGKVMLGRSHRTNKLCAVKILKKDMIIDNGEIQSMLAEKEVFLIANEKNHPFLTNLFCCFQTANRIYFVMEYVSGGDLMWHVQQGNFSLRRAKFYAAEVLLALEHLHEHGVVYRDLKLDNIMLTTDGHIKLADYGLCKQDMWYGKTTNTFCGTPEFMAPEILKEQHYTRAVDWWAFGVLLYQMLLGKSPFRGDDEDEVFNAILTDEPLFPIQMASEAVGLLESLLDKNPQTRLGSGPRDAKEIKDHPYFRNINFSEILELKVPPPYIPEVKSEEDVSYFDKDFTTEVPRLTPVNSILDSGQQAQFRGFSYVNDGLGL